MAFSFPSLKVREIVQCMNELHIPTVEADIKDPQPGHIRGVYESLVELLMGIKVDETQPPNFDAMQVMEFPELHEGSAPKLVMFSALMRMMTACGVRDFTLKDVMKPEYKRTVRHLSAIINFAKFREERLANYQAYMAETDALVEQKQSLEQDNEERATRIHVIKQMREQDAEQVKVLQEEVAALATEINRVNGLQAGLQAEIRKVKDQTTELADVVAGKNFQIQTQEQARNTLRGQIVQSPERIKREIVEMGTTVEQEKENVAFLGQKIRELTERDEALVQAKADIIKSAKLLDETTDQLKKSKTAKEEVEAMKENISVQQQSLKELAAQEQQLKRQETMLQERVARMGRQQDQRREAAAQSLAAVRKERENIEVERLASKSKAEDNEMSCEALEVEIAQHKASHEAEMEELCAEFGLLHEQIGRYHSALLKTSSEVTL